MDLSTFSSAAPSTPRMEFLSICSAGGCVRASPRVKASPPEVSMGRIIDIIRVNSVKEAFTKRAGTVGRYRNEHGYLLGIGLSV